MSEPSLESLVSEILVLKYELGMKYDKDLGQVMNWGNTRVSNLLNVEALKSDAKELRDKLLELKEEKIN